jgi:hypothetical protein
MFRKLKDGYRRFKIDQPGERFIHLHQRWHSEARGVLINVLAVVIGAVLIVAGVLFGLVPGVPGIVLVVLGIGVIAAQFRRLARILDRVEISLRRACRKCRRGWVRGLPTSAPATATASRCGTSAPRRG